MSAPIELEMAYAMDDSCQFQYWAHGHHSWGEFVDAVAADIKRDERDIPWWVVVQAPVKQLYQRAVPCRNSIVSNTRYVHHFSPSRGAYPITLMGFWFPLHALRSKP